MRNIIFRLYPLITILCLSLVFSIPTYAKMSEEAQLGRELFYDPSFGGTLEPKKISGLACADCHADFDEEANPDGKIRAGHSIIGVPYRGEAKGGMIKADIFRRAAGGGGYCYQRFLQRVPTAKVDPTAIPEEQAEALMAYFEHVSGDNKGPQFQLQELDKEAANSAADKIVEMAGDAKKGWKLYSRACNDCHPTARKAGIGSQLIRRRPPSNVPKQLHKYAAKIRGGGFIMPFYSEDRLSDQDIADIIAFLHQEMTAGK
ncbi:MAG: c-type cytochrome [Candidatus Poribacteria bacterium]|nr:c-type cytochrome [Candidatus Poribacteria bacterium]MDE0504339.1 c-type cytochrome [Candidatus Poribacteria bacterium]